MTISEEAIVPGLRDRLAVVPVGADRFIGRAANLPARIYGGEIAAQAVSAANQTVSDDRSPHSLQATYVTAGDPAQLVDYAVERVRDGRSFSTRRVDAYQAARLIFTAVLGYHVAEQGPEHQLAMPDVPDPDRLGGVAASGSMQGKAWSSWQALHTEFDMRPVPPDITHPLGLRAFWCRFLFDETDDAKRQSVLATYASDFTMVSSVRLPHEPPDQKLWHSTTLSHSLYLHRPFTASDWHLVQHRSPVSAGSRGISISHIWTPDGVLVGSGLQEGLLRPEPAQSRSSTVLPETPVDNTNSSARSR